MFGILGILGEKEQINEKAIVMVEHKHSWEKFPGGPSMDMHFRWCTQCGILEADSSDDSTENFIPENIGGVSENKIAEVKISDGRWYLDVSGFVLAVEGDVCRDMKLCGWPVKDAAEVFFNKDIWDKEKLERVASVINRDCVG